MASEETYTRAVEADPFGKCHICEERKPVRYCPRCEHWFCLSCRRNWFLRGYEAVMEKIRGKHPGCCGPLEEN